MNEDRRNVLRALGDVLELFVLFAAVLGVLCASIMWGLGVVGGLALSAVVLLAPRFLAFLWKRRNRKRS